jgi:hypothetical protein
MPKPFQKNLFLSENTNVDKNFEKTNLQFPGTMPEVSDKLRAKCGSFWTTEKPSSKIALFKDMPRTPIPMIMTFHGDPTESPGERNYSFSRTQTIKVTPVQQYYVDDREFGLGTSTEPPAYKEEWFIKDALSNFADLPTGFVFGRDLFENLETTPPPTQKYTDHTIKSNLPFDINDIDPGSMFSPPFVDLKGEYNFYIEGYEQALTEIPEYKIPNMYSFIVESESESSTVDSSISGGGLLDSSAYREFLSEPEGADVRSLKTLKYFKPWTAAVLESDTTGSEFRNVLFSSKNSNEIAKYGNKKRLFPMYCSIDYSTEFGVNFGRAIKDTSLAFSFQKTIADSISGTGDVYTQGLDMFQSIEILGKTQRYYRGRTGGTPRYGERQLFKIENSEPESTLQIEIDEWFDRATGPLPEPVVDMDGATREELESARTLLYDINTEDFIVLDSDSSSSVSSDRSNVLFKSIMSMALSSKLKDLVKLKFRTFEEVMSGAPSYSETVLYRIEKRAGTRTLQDFYILNSTEADVSTFVDTQVKYNKEYQYKIYAYKLVIGTRYSYQNPRRDPADLSSLMMEVVQEPSIRIIETEYFNQKIKIVDNPPMAPDVDFVPFKDEKNKVRLMLNGSPGQTFRERTSIETELPEGKNFYRSDDTISYFEVYRTTEEPKSYSDFVGNIIAEVYTDVSKETHLKASSVSYDDRIKENTKYYYMLRSTDVHGHKSYPSEIFQFEIVHDSGVTYPMLEVFHIDENKGIEYRASAQKMINLIPSQRQLSISESTLESLAAPRYATRTLTASDGTTKQQRYATGRTGMLTASEVESIKLGDVEESVWGKKFRIRATSKKTGRKIEIDVTFNHEHKKLRNSTSTAASEGYAESRRRES